jgi:CheY-like chemotaxis protein
LLLKMEGFDTSAVFDGHCALDEIASSPPDVVLLDIGMPIMDGYEVARRIRATSAGPDIVLVALTGWGQAKDRQQAFAAGFDEHLTKPVDPDKLGRILNETNRRHGDDAAG